MGKTFVRHRLVLRDQNDRIILDLSFDSFAEAQPHYIEASATLKAGYSLCLQHGARIISRVEAAQEL
ncbi:hypothetical protein [Martelella sp. HB161492]|uniref:hypothetical protein n=1 Tax=Martelella sp. HB161492 TaxID=2720726 RepID=UPI001590E4C1|nr:hypothetical protein [Martelella sp. HB161492]